MQRTHVYLPDELNRQNASTTKIYRKSKSEIIREALTKGIKVVSGRKSQSTKALLELAKLAETLPVSTKAPKDAVKNMDYYTWGGKKDE